MLYIVCIEILLYTQSDLLNTFLGNSSGSVFLGFYIFVRIYFFFLAGETNFIPAKHEETLKMSCKTIIKDYLWLRFLC